MNGPRVEVALSGQERRENLLKTYEVVTSGYESESGLFWTRWSHLLATNGLLATAVGVIWRVGGKPIVPEAWGVWFLGALGFLGAAVCYVWIVSSVRCTVNTYTYAAHAATIEKELGLGGDGTFTNAEAVLKDWHKGDPCAACARTQVPDWLYCRGCTGRLVQVLIRPPGFTQGVRKLTAVWLPFLFLLAWLSLLSSVIGRFIVLPIILDCL